MPINALNSAQEGIRRGFQRLQAASEATARISEESASDPFVANAKERILANAEVSANVAVARTANEMMRSVLDIHA